MSRSRAFRAPSLNQMPRQLASDLLTLQVRHLTELVQSPVTGRLLRRNAVVALRRSILELSVHIRSRPILARIWLAARNYGVIRRALRAVRSRS